MPNHHEWHEDQGIAHQKAEERKRLLAQEAAKTPYERIMEMLEALDSMELDIVSDKCIEIRERRWREKTTGR